MIKNLAVVLAGPSAWASSRAPCVLLSAAPRTAPGVRPDGRRYQGGDRGAGAYLWPRARAASSPAGVAFLLIAIAGYREENDG